MGTLELRGTVVDPAVVCTKQGRGTRRNGAGWLSRSSKFPETSVVPQMNGDQNDFKLFAEMC